MRSSYIFITDSGTIYRVLPRCKLSWFTTAVKYGLPRGKLPFVCYFVNFIIKHHMVYLPGGNITTVYVVYFCMGYFIHTEPENFDLLKLEDIS